MKKALMKVISYPVFALLFLVIAVTLPFTLLFSKKLREKWIEEFM